MPVTVRDFIERNFPPGKRPDPRTVRRRILRGLLPGYQEGRFYFVHEDVWRARTGNGVADRIIERGETDGTRKNER